jgi:nitronate monooxygenase
MCQAQSLRQVEQALDVGADAIVAQGTEAGGHGGARSTFPFVPEAADYIARRSPDTLLLAAGGVADGRGLAAALMLGADAVVLGSRFWSSAEALTPTAATDLAARSTGDNTVRTTAVDALRGVPWPRDFSFRMIRNALADRWVGHEAEAWDAFGSLKAAYDEARVAGNLDMAATVAGEAIGLINGRPPAADIIAAMVRDAAARLSAAPRKVIVE